MAQAADESEGHGEVEAGAFLANVRRGEIDGDALAGGKFVLAIAQGGLDALAAFFEVVHVRGADVNLDFDEVGVDAVDGRAERFEEHGGQPRCKARARAQG